jgi:hypothetical protein
MDGVRPSPVAIGGEGQDSQQEAEHVIGGSGLKKRAVPTVMLDDEKSNQEPGGRNCEEQGHPIRVFEASQHEKPQDEEGNGAVEQLKEAASKDRSRVGC